MPFLCQKHHTKRQLNKRRYLKKIREKFPCGPVVTGFSHLTWPLNFLVETRATLLQGCKNNDDQ